MSCTAAKQKRNLHDSSLDDEHPPARKRPHLGIGISLLAADTSSQQSQMISQVGHEDDDDDVMSGVSEPNSLFDELLPASPFERQPIPPSPALLTAPPIPGLFFTPSLRIPTDLAADVFQYCLETYFREKGSDGINQAMLFGRLTEPDPSISSSIPSSGLPLILHRLLDELESSLRLHLPPSAHSLLFPSPKSQQARRQVILNLYKPGEGISRHVDLVNRFGDGIIGVSLGSGCVMQFVRADTDRDRDGATCTRDAAFDIMDLVESSPPSLSLGRTSSTAHTWDLYLPERSVLVLTSEARYNWTHGIDARRADFVAVADNGLVDDEMLVGQVRGKWIDRGLRLSVTFRWMVPGADVIGDD